MSQEKSSKGKIKIGAKQLIIIGITVAIACGVILLIGYFLNHSFEEFSSEEMAEITDEITRIRHFVSDWHAELCVSGKGECEVYFNELRFGGGNYTLSSAGGRIRAVYPRGERFFKLEQVSRLEFFEIEGKLRCRVYYGKSGEYTFAV